MPKLSLSRRSFVKQMGYAGALATTSAHSNAFAVSAAAGTPQANKPEPGDATREQRMKWWHEAKFGMFIHWGLYSVIGQQEWAIEHQGIPLAQYEILAKHFKPKPNAAREWAKLAKRAGQKYMVMTTKHHEGFCMWDTKLTDYNAAKQGPGCDLVREYVEAARAEGLRVGFYYSLMDWHHPDGARCATDEEARKRFVEYTHGLIRELLTNYGKIDVLWYDVSSPLDAEGWESERMNKMVFELQPEIIVNNRNKLEGDFSTPEQHIEASKEGRAWESCMTLNDSWGYSKADDDWKTPRTIVNNLATCARGGGNYLLNIGPKADGSVPEESVRILEAVGRWMDTNGKSIYTAERINASGAGYANFTGSGNTLYIHVYAWPGATPAQEWLSFYQPPCVLSFGGMQGKVKSARLLKTGAPVTFTQDELHLRLTGLPEQAPDDPVTVIAVECENAPSVDARAAISQWPRLKAGISYEG
jgi:alpha-L-fucosidase